MSASTRPIEIDAFTEAIKSITEAEISLLEKQVTNSIARLERSNLIMKALLQKAKGETVNVSMEGIDEDEFDVGEQGEDDIKIYKDSIRENEIVLNNLNRRMDALENEKLSRTKSAPETPVRAQKPSKVIVDADNDVIDPNAPNSVFL